MFVFLLGKIESYSFILIILLLSIKLLFIILNIIAVIQILFPKCPRSISEQAASKQQSTNNARVSRLEIRQPDIHKFSALAEPTARPILMKNTSLSVSLWAMPKRKPPVGNILKKMGQASRLLRGL